MTVAKEHPRLKLGKRASFVKTHLKQLPQEEETWEADFRALPKPADQTETHYLGLVVALPKGDPLVYLPVEYTPTVNDLADLLADAMRRPLTGSARRPEHIHFRANPRWEELFPHLKELGIEVTLQDELPELEEVYLDFLREMRKASPGPIIMLSPRPARCWPAVPRHQQMGSGERLDRGRAARRMPVSWPVRWTTAGLVFENNSSNTLAEALAALEEGLAGRFRDHEAALRPSSPTAKKKSQKPRNGP